MTGVTYKSALAIYLSSCPVLQPLLTFSSPWKESRVEARNEALSSWGELAG